MRSRSPTGRSLVAGPRSWIAVLATVGLAAVCGGLVPAPTGAAPASALKAMWGPYIMNGQSQFPTYRTLGVKIYEDDLHWDLIAPTRPHNARNPNHPAYRWPAEVTAAVAQARKYDISVALEIIGAPPWANGGHTWNWAPQNPDDYANFAAAASKRYPSVHLW